MFIEQINNVTGQREWVVADENYDLAQEIARSAFADMLLDHDRNIRYKQALERVIAGKKQAGEFVHVVDIGTGTGLLSLMAAEAGADKVTAIEVFEPMAKMAAEIFKNSKYGERIELISSRSTDLNKSSLTERGNLIVAEVFDTELIGEGALRTFKEAHETLVKRGSRVIPSSAKVWALPVQSHFMERFNKPPDGILKSPFNDCPGSAAVFDIQLSQVSTKDFQPLGKPFLAFEFNFEDPDSINYDESKVHEFIVSHGGNAAMNAVFMWWDLDMDGSGENILTMAPTWFDSNFQAAYFLPTKKDVAKDERIKIHCAHDEYSLWFAIEDPTSTNKAEKPNCKCHLHSICARSSLYRMNDLEENEGFIEFLEKICRNKTVVCLNEGSLIGLYAAQYAVDVTIVDSNQYFRMALENYKGINHLTNVRIVESVEEISEPPSVILSEPFYFSSISLWNNLRVWFEMDKLKRRFPNNNFEIFPKHGSLYAMSVRFDHLWKIASKVGVVEGHNLSKFDDLCQKARGATDSIVEPQPLWEYESISTGTPIQIASFDLTTPLPKENVIFENTIQPTEQVYHIWSMKNFRPTSNAITFWMEWGFSDELTIQTGPLNECHLGKSPRWHPGHRQGVYFLGGLHEHPKINTRTEFQIVDGEITFKVIHV